MFRISNIKVPVNGTQELKTHIAETLNVPSDEIQTLSVRRRSLDARKRSQVHFVFTCDVSLKDPSAEKRLIRRHGRQLGLSRPDDVHYAFPYEAPASIKSSEDLRPVIIGAGPAGLFCALELARAGFAPIVIERGAPVDERAADVERFWEGGELKNESNVCFGEGGAGAFSDGKLTSSANDIRGLNTHVLETFVRFGADIDILSWYRPHIGTDRLRPIMKAIREEIIACGGEVRFHTRFEDFVITTDLITGRRGIKAVVVRDTVNGREESISCRAAVLACGHSAHDTFYNLSAYGLEMHAKAFAIGFRVQHLQSVINEAQYGPAAPYLGAADYRLSAKSSSGRGVYSFCMCPGGYVVNSSSETGLLTVNGMSYQDRAGANANAAIVVTVGPEDFASDASSADDAFSGIHFQRRLEEKAWQLAGGAIPAGHYGDLLEGVSVSDGGPEPAFKGSFVFTDLRGLLPKDVEDSFIEGMTSFGRKIPGFDSPQTLIAGIESRTSSAIRIPRDKGGEASVSGIFPCGEGPGWAGGIMSSAVDGISQAEHAAAAILHFLQ